MRQEGYGHPPLEMRLSYCNLSYLPPRKPDRALERSEMPDAGKVDSVNVSPSQSAKAVVVLHARTVELG